MNLASSRLKDLGIVAVIAVAGFLYLKSDSRYADALEEQQTLRDTIQALTTTQSELASAPAMAPLADVWNKSRRIVDRCGVQKTVLKNADDSLYTGSGHHWSAELTGPVLPVLTCADRLSGLDQIAFEQLSISSAGDSTTADVKFSIFGTFEGPSQ